MPDPSSLSNPGVALNLAAVSHCLGDPRRLRILAALAGGEALMVAELAERIGCSANLASKHVTPLRHAGLITAGRNGLYRIPPQFLPEPAARVADFGFFTLRAARMP